MSLSKRQAAFLLNQELRDVQRRIREFTGEMDTRSAMRVLREMTEPLPRDRFWAEGEWIKETSPEPQVGSRTSIHTVGSAGLPSLGKR